VENDRREIFGWTMYAWAYHGFVTTVSTVLLGPYVTSLAQRAAGVNGPVFAAPVLSGVTAKGFFFYCVSLSVFLQLFLLPILGAVADRSRLKKRLLALTCASGSLATALLFFVGAPLDYRWGGLLFVIANLSLGATSVVYNSLLPEISSPDRRDQVSSRGYAMGYLGGGILLAANLAFMAAARRLGVSTDLAVRICLLSAGLWWAGFALVTFRRLRPRPPVAGPPSARLSLTTALAGLGAALGDLRRLRHTRRFLAAYLLFNDGVHTVTAVASVFLAQELFVARGRAVDQRFLLGVMLMVQFVGFAGAVAFGRIAAALGAKRALILSLAVWSAAIVYCYRALQTEGQAWAAAAVMGMVLGGSQALSRSLFSRMIPPGREAAFFSLYEVTNSGTSWIGPFLFAAVVGATGSYRQALLSLIVLFVGGLVCLVLTDTERAIADVEWARPPLRADTRLAGSACPALPS
jgi:MFS transporter, UMF1 family